MEKKFYGWWITIFAFFTFGLAVGILAGIASIVIPGVGLVIGGGAAAAAIGGAAAATPR